jgi:hypothetical protein
MKDWLNNKIIEKEIDGHTIKFRRISVGTLQKFRVVGEEVATLLALVFKDTSKDAKVEQIEQPTDKKDSTGASLATKSYVQEDAKPAIIELRARQMREGIEGLLKALTKDEALDVLAEIIVASAFEEFEESDIPKIKTELSPDLMVQFLCGAFEVSTGDFAKLGKSWCQKNPQIKEILASVK